MGGIRSRQDDAEPEWLDFVRSAKDGLRLQTDRSDPDAQNSWRDLLSEVEARGVEGVPVGMFAQILLLGWELYERAGRHLEAIATLDKLNNHPDGGRFPDKSAVAIFRCRSLMALREFEEAATELLRLIPPSAERDRTVEIYVLAALKDLISRAPGMTSLPPELEPVVLAMARMAGEEFRSSGNWDLSALNELRRALGLSPDQ